MAAEPGLESHGLSDDHLRADGNAIEEIDDVVVDEPEAARRDGVADRLGLVGAMNAIDGLPEIEGARPHRVAWATGHEARQIGLTLDHLRRRAPVGPFLLARYSLQARPLEAVASDANAIAKRAVVGLDEVEETLARVDDDGARRFVRAEEHFLFFVDAAQLLFVGGRHVAWLVDDVHIDLLSRRENARQDKRRRRDRPG